MYFVVAPAGESAENEPVILLVGGKGGGVPGAKSALYHPVCERRMSFALLRAFFGETPCNRGVPFLTEDRY